MSHPFGCRPHAALGASAAQRWMGCPGSVRLAAGIEAPASTYAEKGAAAHALAEICLTGGIDALALIGRERNGHVVDAEMADSVQVYLDSVRAERGPDDVLMVEQHFSLDRLHPPGEMFGTADAVIYKPALRRLVVFDLKYGAGVAVEAAGNPQARYYGLGGCMALAEHPVAEVEIIIVQPRAPHPAGPIRRETVSAFELVEWSADLLEAAERTLAADAPLVPGAWCRFCLAAGICPALHDQALATAQVEFAVAPLPSPPAPASVPTEQDGRLLVAAELVELRIRGAPCLCACRARGGDGSSTVGRWSSSARPGAGAMTTEPSSSCRRSGCPSTSSRALRRSRSCLAPAASARSLIWSSPKAMARRSRAIPITALRFCPA